MDFVFLILFILLLIYIITQVVNSKSENEEYQKRVDTYQKKVAGKEGENYAKTEIKRILNDDDNMFSNIEVIFENKRCEIDNLIVNSNGIFIVEVKNYNGSLLGDADDKHWTKHKVSPGGKDYFAEIDNPIKQVKRQQYILGKVLESNDIRFRNKGIVYLVNRNNSISHEMIVKDITLLENIIHTNYGKELYPNSINKINNLMENNRTGESEDLINNIMFRLAA